jgi:hypothetical protein
MMRECVAAERLASSAGPEAVKRFRESIRDQFDRVPDVFKILNEVNEDPKVAAALADPLVLAAVKDAFQLGPAEMEKKYGGNEGVMLLVRKLLPARDGKWPPS